MVAASVRHLHSLRLLRRDKGWINSLLQEAANERQHLLTALKLYKPGKFMRLMLLFTQGIFYNFFFIFYLISPRVAHRFVGFLEEEAVLTYTRVAEEIAEGRLPEWENYVSSRAAPPSCTELTYFLPISPCHSLPLRLLSTTGTSKRTQR
jgi:ubiquinol oxidase